MTDTYAGYFTTAGLVLREPLTAALKYPRVTSSNC